jgi:hypothetical protein
MAAKPSKNLIPLVGGAATGAGGAVCLATLGWPTVALGGALIIALMWTLSSPDRTRRLASLIRAIRGGPGRSRNGSK